MSAYRIDSLARHFFELNCYACHYTLGRSISADWLSHLMNWWIFSSCSHSLSDCPPATNRAIRESIERGIDTANYYNWVGNSSDIIIQCTVLISTMSIRSKEVNMIFIDFKKIFTTSLRLDFCKDNYVNHWNKYIFISVVLWWRIMIMMCNHNDMIRNAHKFSTVRLSDHFSRLFSYTLTVFEFPSKTVF